jgi:GPH family glycoside/pentoside/hexuronide:cation symporter
LLEGQNAAVWKGTHGVVWVSLGAAALVLITGLMPVFFCHEKDHGRGESKVPFLTAAGYTVRNPAFWPLVISNFLKRVGIQITGIFFYYIIIYRTAEGDNALGATEWALFCNTINGATFLAMFPVVKFTDWFGKQQTLMLFMGLSALTYASIWWTMRPGWWIPLLITGVCIGVFCNTMPTIVNSMLAGVCDEDELQSGHRREAFYGAAFVMTDKMAMAFTTLAQGWLLLASGFVASQGRQSPETIAYWMKWLIITQPTGFLLGLAFIFFYPITRERARETRAILDARQCRHSL